MIFKSILLFIIFNFQISSLFAADNNSVVCIHGFMGSSWNMWFLQKNLKKEGWDAVIWDYSSRAKMIEDQGRSLVTYLDDLASLKPNRPIHFVTHSMGSLVLLSALNDPGCPEEAKCGKVIMLAPPIHGSSWGRYIGQYPWAKWIAGGFCGHQLMTKSDFQELGYLPDTLEKVLVIAGSFGFNPFLVGKNDGTLEIKETILPTPHEHVVINRGHKTIIFSKKAYNLVSDFLKR